MDFEALGKRIKKYRNMKEMTQAQLAEKLELSTGYLGRLERAEKKISLPVLERISICLEIPIQNLIADLNENDETYLKPEFAERFYYLSAQSKKYVMSVMDELPVTIHG